MPSQGRPSGLPNGEISRSLLNWVLCHPGVGGGTGVSLPSPPPCSRFAGREGRGGSCRSGGTGPALIAAVCFPLGYSAPGTGELLPPAQLLGWAPLPWLCGETLVSLGWEREEGSSPSSLPPGKGSKGPRRGLEIPTWSNIPQHRHVFVAEIPSVVRWIYNTA